MKNAEKRLKHYQSNLNKYGKFTNAIIEGNKNADTIINCSLSLSPPSSPLFLTKGNDIWQLISRNNDSPIYENVKNTIFRALQPLEALTIATEAVAFLERLLNPLVSSQHTTYIFRTHKQKHSQLADFIHRLLNKSLPTKKKLAN
jgi:hypothetical protein